MASYPRWNENHRTLLLGYYAIQSWIPKKFDYVFRPNFFANTNIIMTKKICTLKIFFIQKNSEKILYQTKFHFQHQKKMLPNFFWFKIIWHKTILSQKCFRHKFFWVIYKKSKPFFGFMFQTPGITILTKFFMSLVLNIWNLGFRIWDSGSGT